MTNYYPEIRLSVEKAYVTIDEKQARRTAYMFSRLILRNFKRAVHLAHKSTI